MSATPETSDRPVVTRFAPSPTGALHIGGARTALFAWAYARKHNGKFILRIEDTDLKRSSPESTKGIIRDLMWLGLNWDEGPKGPCMKSGCGCGKGPDEDFDPYGRQIGDAGPYFQSQRAEQGIYDTYVDLLLQAGEAYEDGGAVRLKMGAHRGDIAFDDAVYGHIEVPAADLEDFVIRKGEDGGKLPTFHFAVVVDDALMGVTHVIRGQEHLTNTSKHAAIYDALAKITGDTQTWARPVWVHTPSIMNPGGSKMSKRDKAKIARQAANSWIEQQGNTPDKLLEFICDAFLAKGGITGPFAEKFKYELPAEFVLEGDSHTVKWTVKKEYSRHKYDGAIPAMRGPIFAFLAQENDNTGIARTISDGLGVVLPEINVDDFRQSGYLPGVALNYVALLGWNPGGDVERFDLDFLTEHFSLDRIGKSNSTFDREKLFRFSADTMVELPPEEFQSLLKAHLDAYHPEYAAITADDALFVRFCEAYQPRTRTLSEPAALAQFLIVEDGDIAYDFSPKPIRKAMTGNENQGLKLLAELRDAFAALPEDGFGSAAHDLMNTLAEQSGINMGKYAQPVRVAVSGGVVTPPLDLTLDLLGKEKTLARIENCLNSDAARAALA